VRFPADASLRIKMPIENIDQANSVLLFVIAELI